jgi:hypothetical protein
MVVGVSTHSQSGVKGDNLYERRHPATVRLD